MSNSSYGTYTDEDDEARFLHNHHTAVVGGPSSRPRHQTSFRAQSPGGKVLQITTFGLAVAFNIFLAWVAGRTFGFW